MDAPQPPHPFIPTPGDGSLRVFFGVELEMIVIPGPSYHPITWTAKGLSDKIVAKRKHRPNSFEYKRWKAYTLEQILQEAPADVVSFTNEHFAQWLADQYAVYLEVTASQAKQVGFEPRKAHVSWYETKVNRNYKEWQITEDISLASNHKENKYGLEFVGPIMIFQNSPECYKNVKREIDFFYTFLTEHCQCKIEADTSCSTHVHASLGPDIAWTLQDVKQLACAAYFFEPALNALLPIRRVTTRFAKGLRMTPIADGLCAPPFKEYDHNAQIKITKGQVIDNLNFLNHELTDAASIIALIIPNSDRDTAWNFSNLKIFGDNNFGTVEYRRPQGSATADDAVRWIELVASFVLAAQATDMLTNPIILADLTVGNLTKFIAPFRAVPPGLPTSLDQLLKEKVNEKVVGGTMAESNEIARKQQAEASRGLAPKKIEAAPTIRRGVPVISATSVEMFQKAAADPEAPQEIQNAAVGIAQMYEQQQEAKAAAVSFDPPMDTDIPKDTNPPKETHPPKDPG